MIGSSEEPLDGVRMRHCTVRGNLVVQLIHASLADRWLATRRGVRLGLGSLNQAVLLVTWGLLAEQMLFLLSRLVQFEHLHVLLVCVEYATFSLAPHAGGTADLRVQNTIRNVTGRKLKVSIHDTYITAAISVEPQTVRVEVHEVGDSSLVEPADRVRVQRRVLSAEDHVPHVRIDHAIGGVHGVTVHVVAATANITIRQMLICRKTVSVVAGDGYLSVSITSKRTEPYLSRDASPTRMMGRPFFCVQYDHMRNNRHVIGMGHTGPGYKEMRLNKQYMIGVPPQYSIYLLVAGAARRP